MFTVPTIATVGTVVTEERVHSVLMVGTVLMVVVAVTRSTIASVPRVRTCGIIVTIEVELTVVKNVTIATVPFIVVVAAMDASVLMGTPDTIGTIVWIFTSDTVVQVCF